MRDTFDQVVDKLESWGNEFVLMLPNLGAALLILLGFWLGARVASNLVCRVVAQLTKQETLVNLVARVVRFLILATGFIVALQVLNLDKAATTFLAGAGIIGLALGFAFQDLSANFIAGVALAIRRPMRVGDLIDTNDIFGTVRNVHLRTTTMHTPEGQVVVIPNRKIFENALTNYSTLGRRRIDLEVGVSYGDDLDKVRQVTLEAVTGLDRLADTQVELFFEEFGDSSINFVVRFWVAFARQPDYLAARSAAVMAIKAAYDANDITIPFPIRTLDFGIVGGEKLDERLTAWSKAKAS
jgi:small conductance mechanosensitive channel